MKNSLFAVCIVLMALSLALIVRSTRQPKAFIPKDAYPVSDDLIERAIIYTDRPRITRALSQAEIEADINEMIGYVLSELAQEQERDGFSVVDTRLRPTKHGFTGTVVISYMSAPGYLSSQSIGKVSVTVDRGFYYWQIGK